jgi:hypothetical protein
MDNSNSKIDGVLEDITKVFSSQNEVLAIALGGSQSTGEADGKSYYDFYVYLNSTLDNDIRKNILSAFCIYMEIGNTFWELGDNCTLNDGTYIDIMYRNLDSFTKSIAGVVEDGICYNGYTTCMWDNLMNCKIIYEKDSSLTKIKQRFSVPYPKALKINIIDRNMKLLTGLIGSYDNQIKESVFRKDLVNINNRISAFLASYFDLIFALNEVMNPGEKRLMEISKEKCKLLPKGFEINIQSLFYCISNDINKINEIIEKMVYEIKDIAGSSCVA